MATNSCGMKYFCLGAFLIFFACILLCALGFTIVLPHMATRTWRHTICNVTNSSYAATTCSCGQRLVEDIDCVNKYPCLQVWVAYQSDQHTPPLQGFLFRAWKDSFYNTCSLYECGDKHWNVQEATKFRLQYGQKGQQYNCYYNPRNSQNVILQRTPVEPTVHAILWPLLCLVAGGAIWIGLCFECWQLEDDQQPKDRYGYACEHSP